MQIGCLQNGLVIDDYALLGISPGRGCGATAASCFSGKLFDLYYRPMVTSSFRYVQTQHVHSDHPFWYHLENLILFAVVLSFAAALFKAILRQNFPALLATSLFGLHPIQVSVTTFIGGRTDLLALVFLLPCLIALVKCSRVLRASRIFPNQALRFELMFLGLLVFSVACLTLAAFSKEQSLPMLLLAPLLAGYTLRKRKRLRLTGKQFRFPYWQSAYLMAASIYGAASYRVIGKEALPRAPWGIPLRIEMVGRTLWYFTKAFLFPTVTILHLSTLGDWDVPQVGIAIAGFCSAALFLWLLIKQWHCIQVRIMLLWIVLSLFTCVNLVPIPSQFASPFRAEVPMFGFAGAAACLLIKAAKSIQKRWQDLQLNIDSTALMLAAPAFLWYAITIQADVPRWHDEFVLMKAEVEADPNFVVARAAYANYWSFPPVPDRKPDYQQSLTYYEGCIKQLYGSLVPFAELSERAARPEMQRRIMSGSGLRYEASVYVPQLLRGYAGVYHNLGQFDKAIEIYGQTLNMLPQDTDTLNALVYLCGTQARKCDLVQDRVGVIRYCRIVLKYMPDNQQARNALATEYRLIGQKDKADAVLRYEDRFTHQVP
jgi:hypothetical protein